MLNVNYIISFLKYQNYWKSFIVYLHEKKINQKFHENIITCCMCIRDRSDIFKWNFPIYDYLCIWAINDIQVPTTREKSHINEDFTIKEVKCLQAFAFSKNEFSIFLQPGWKRNMQYTFTIFEVFISQYVDARTCSKLKCLEIFAVFICILNISTGKNEEVENRRLWISFPSNDFMLCINVS